ncbi:MAG: hypothetical protein DCC58_12530 [Chloroflexi bacterium]|nr:MAG: hypothetical protein DCC58_12530 [Chloroflexota bacterium]
MLGRSNAGGRPILIATIAGALIFLVGIGIWYQFFRDDAPPPVSLEHAVSSVSDATATAAQAAAPNATSAAATATSVEETSSAAATTQTDDATATAEVESPTGVGLSGSWSVDGSQDTFVGYRVGEELAGIGTTEAVGRTADITGSASVDDLTVTAASFEADLTTLKSDNSMRDGQLGRQGIETNIYPTATFVLTQPLSLDAALLEGQALHVVATGDLTLHGVTNSVQVPLDLQYTNGVIVVVGSLEIQLADYDINPPSSMRVLAINDYGTLELQLFFRR